MKNFEKTHSLLALLAAAGLAISGCSESTSNDQDDGHSHADGGSHDSDDHGHSHGDGGGHDHDGEGHGSDGDNDAGDHDHGEGGDNDAHGHDHGEGGDHDHDHGPETPLAAATIGDMTVELAQAHGPLKAGEEGHLVIKLPYSDNGATIVRAWIGGEDRTLSMVGKGAYAPSHDDYDVHAMAPDPLPANTMWWIEVEKPDGTKVVGSAKPLME